MGRMTVERFKEIIKKNYSKNDLDFMLAIVEPLVIFNNSAYDEGYREGFEDGYEIARKMCE